MFRLFDSLIAGPEAMFMAARNNSSDFRSGCKDVPADELI
jgi:hypothetical protein